MSVVPVRGTQSFVGVMVEVFKRPSLTGIEVLWRWVFWTAVLAWPVSKVYPSLFAFAESVQARGFGGWAGWWSYLFTMRVNNTFEAVTLLAGLGLLWAAASALGRSFLLRRTDPLLRPRFLSSFVLGFLRWLFWVAAVALWLGVLKLALDGLVNRPLAQGGEPQWVLFTGVEIVATLVSFVVWLATSWMFSLAILYTAQNGWDVARSLREACKRGSLSGKLAEINLVMGIVKIALMVLAMVFSACPLPFESVETQSFLVSWTASVLLLYFLASDYFHVVRLVAFLRMTEVFGALPKDAAAPERETAS